MLLLTIGCAAPHTRTLDDIARGYVRAALALAQHQPSLVEDWRGDEAWRPAQRVPVAETRRDIATLRTELTAIDRGAMSPVDRGRAGYLRRQLDAVDLAAQRLLGAQMPFADEIVAAFGVPLPPIDASRLQHAREALARLLPGSGSLGARQAVFRRSVTVPHGREAEVLHAALEACRAATREHLELPADESVDLRVGVDTPWDGFARHQGNHRSLVEVSGRSPLDVSRALRLACHEAYPGHHVQHVLLDRAAATDGRLELQLQPAFGLHLLVAEGAAEIGADLAFPPDARARIYRELLLPRAGLPGERADLLVAVETEVFALEPAIPTIVSAYLDARASRDATLDALATDAAVMDPETLLAFVERQRTRAFAYGLGRHLVGTWLTRQPGDTWDNLSALFSTRAFALE